MRITAHAFGENRPARDLLLSPGHSVAVDLLGEALIPASSLVNGSTIRQEKVERVTYWHVELESHDLLLSENLATESYLEMGNRSFFVDGREVVALYSVPDAPAAKTLADFCRPYHAEGALVSFVRDRLKARAMQLGWAEIEDPLADIHLVVDGRRIEPEVRDLSARFLVPKTAQAVQLVSNAAVPMDVGVAADVRMLGLCVGRIVISDGFGGEDVIPADDPRLCIGFHHVEDGPQRWTTGSAKLPSDLWKGRSSDVFLRVELTRSALPRWIKSADPLVAVAPLALAGLTKRPSLDPNGPETNQGAEDDLRGALFRDRCAGARLHHGRELLAGRRRQLLGIDGAVVVGVGRLEGLRQRGIELGLVERSVLVGIGLADVHAGFLGIDRAVVVGVEGGELLHRRLLGFGHVDGAVAVLVDALHDRRTIGGGIGRDRRDGEGADREERGGGEGRKLHRDLRGQGLMSSRSAAM